MERKESDPDRKNQSDRNRQRDTEQESSSSTAEAEPVASLHQAVGNQAVKRLHEGGVLQANLAVSRPDDPAEREAERVAEQVMNASAERRATADATSEEPPGGDRGGSTQPAVTPIVDRAPQIDESPHSGGAGSGQRAGEDVERALESSSGGKPLPSAARSFFEPRFGRDFGDVRVHTGGVASDLNRQLHAKAFTHGSDIYFGEGQYRPGSADGRQLMAHELTHVVQQTNDGGRSGDRTSATTIQRRASTGERGAINWDERSSEELFQMWVENDYQHGNAPPDAPPKEKVQYEVRRRLDWKEPETLDWFLQNDPYVNHANGYWLREAIRYRKGEAAPDESKEEQEFTSAEKAELPEKKETVYNAQVGEDIYRVKIVGHASPRWRHPEPQSRAERNLALSHRRAKAVEDAVREDFLERGEILDWGPIRDDHPTSLEAVGVGHAQTLVEAGGEVTANDPELRRVDVLIEHEKTVQTTRTEERTVEEQTGATKWAVKIFLVEAVSGVSVPVAGSAGLGKIKNRETNKVVKGGWGGLGYGQTVDDPFPTVSLDPSWAKFEMAAPVTFEHFEGSKVRLTHIDIGIGKIGLTWAYIRFLEGSQGEGLMNESANISGFVMNQWGVGGTQTWGLWYFIEDIPSPPTTKRTEQTEVTTKAKTGASFGHQVYFETESAQISDSELDRLDTFIHSLPGLAEGTREN